MSVWGKIVGGAAGYALGGPLGALLGAAAGHAVDRMRARRDGAQGAAARQAAFGIAVIVLSAKMAKADGHVSQEEVDAFRQVFRVPPGQAQWVGRIFDHARQDSRGFEPYARQVARMFARQPAVLEELLGALFHIAKADGAVRPEEVAYLRRVAEIFGFDSRAFERIRAVHTGPEPGDPYRILGVAPDAPDAEVKAAYRRLVREHHPDRLIAQGMPPEFIDVATEKAAAINAAYDTIREERGGRETGRGPT